MIVAENLFYSLFHINFSDLMEATIYCLGGLVSGKEVFQNIKPEGIDMVYIPYNAPKENEGLSDYSKRLFLQLELPDDYQLLGVSFGGVIAMEFYKLKKPKRLYLVSSFSKVPLKFKLAFFLKIHKLRPRLLLEFLKIVTQILFRMTKKKDRDRIKKSLSLKDVLFIKWAFKHILSWKYIEVPEAVRIHGTLDEILPYPKKTDYPITNGTHFIIANRSKEIAEILSLNNR